MLRLLSVLRVVVLAITHVLCPIAVAQPLVPLMEGWSQAVEDDYWVASSPNDAQGAVVVLALPPVSFFGAFEGWFKAAARRWTEDQIGPVQRMEDYRSLNYSNSRPLAATYEATNSNGHSTAVYVLGFVASPGRAQIVVALAPGAALRGGAPSVRTLRLHWSTAQQMAGYMANNQIVVTPQWLAAVSAHVSSASTSPQPSPTGPAPAPTASPPTATPPAAEPLPSWSARFDGTGVTLVPPCGAGGANIRAGVFRSVTDFATFPGVIGGEVEALIRAWTGGGQARGYGTMEVQGNIASMAASFVANGQLYVGWFAVSKRGQLTQRGYVVWPETDKQDPRLPQMIQAVRQVLASNGQPQLELTGTPPAPVPASRELEAVLQVPGGVFADDRHPVNPAVVEIALWKNGAVTQSRGGARGRWHSLAGGAYAVAIEGGIYDSSVMHLSGTCRVAAKTAMQPPPPPAPPSSGTVACRSHDIQTAHYPSTQCTMIGGQRSCTTVLKPVHTRFSFCD